MRTRFFYDIVCPYTYLAATQVEQLAADTGAEIEWIPMLLGGLFVPIEHLKYPLNR